MLLRSVLTQTGRRWVSVSHHLQGSLKATVENPYLIVRVNGEKPLKFPNIWLRDNCQCSECFHEDTQSRKINWEKFNPKVKIKSVCADYDRKAIKIDWSDKHHSFYELDWLKDRDFCKENRDRYLQEFYRPKHVLWGQHDFEKHLHTYNYEEIMQSDEALKKWLQTLTSTGVAMIKNAPLDKGTARELIEKVGFIRKTHYGEEFIVQAKSGAKNFAYQSTHLQLHTDLPYYEHKVGVNILHCVVQTDSEGGDSLLSDGFYVAERMRTEYPEYFEILKDILVDWNDIGQEEDGKPFHLIYRSPVIGVDREGNYTRINYSVPQRDSHFTVPLEKVVPWYEAFAMFVRILNDEAVKFKLTPGDILTFNNMRLTHGRTAYDDNSENVRYIVGAYIDWDVVHSKLRVLKSNKEKNV